ncbi:MAG: glycoside hydrolase family 43 protein [Fibrobacterota bacterium]|nr:glycoside hydrolase family 43 protein [Chitinispirillaceae bacterium]
MFIKRIVAGSGILLILSSMLFADNPIISQRYTADPNAFVFKDRVYVMCSSDEDNPSDGYNLLNYTLVSSDDMVNWTDHNLVFKVKSNTTWAGQAYAPTAIARNGKVYLYFPNGTSGIGVLSADQPEGPYKDMLGKPIIDPKAPNCSDIEWFFDPCIFVDSTASGSQAYLLVGGGKPYGNNFIIVKVNADMKSYSGTPQKLTTPNSFEGPFLHKYNNKYYLHYPTNGASNIDYIMSDNPMTGWGSQARTVLPNPTLNGKNINLGNNSHESIIEYKGKWYMFYHDRRLSNATYKRNACVDYLNYNSDGTMKTVVVTSEGPAQIKNLNPYDTIQAETIWKQQGIETEFCNEGGVMVTNISQGDYTSLKGVDFGTGAKTFEVRAASASSGTVEVHLDSPTGTLVATCTIAGTGGLQTWKTSTCDVTNLTGVKNIYFVYKGSGEPYRLNWFRFTPIDPVGVHSSPKAVVPALNQKPAIVNPLNVDKTPGRTTFDLSGKVIERVAADKPMQLAPSAQMRIVK